MTMRTANLYGVREELAAKLKSEGVAISAKLLAAANTPKARRNWPPSWVWTAKRYWKWPCLARSGPHQGCRHHSDLLEQAGVDTVAELARRNAENLYSKIVETAGEHFVQRLPRLEEVIDSDSAGQGIAVVTGSISQFWRVKVTQTRADSSEELSALV